MVAHHPDIGVLGTARQATREPVKPDHPIKAAGGQLELGPAVVQQPAQPALDAGPLADEVLAMIQQQLDLARRALQGRHGQRVDRSRPKRNVVLSEDELDRLAELTRSDDLRVGRLAG